MICMYGLGYDPDVPAGYQDADIEMAEMRDAANEAAALSEDDSEGSNEEEVTPDA